MNKNCSRCHQKITDRFFLTCSVCLEIYDIECANVSEKRFMNTFTTDHKKNWKCHSCLCNMPKKTNSNTRIPVKVISENTSKVKQNSTIKTRSKKSFVDCSNNEYSQEDTPSIFGDTICESVEPSPYKMDETNDIITRMSTLLNEKLALNNLSLITDLKKIIQTEILKAVSDLRNEFKEKTETLGNDIKNSETKIINLNEKIIFLENETSVLRHELDKLKKQGTFITQNPDHSKKIVIHGLQELYNEPEFNLYERLTYIFGDIQNVNLVGYIEDTHRIGKHYHQRRRPRPLVIELLSKQIANYILHNKQNFHNTGLSVTEYLDYETIQKRRQMRSPPYETTQKRLNETKHIEPSDYSEYYSDKLHIDVATASPKSTKDQTPQSPYSFRDY